jgi:hypothetical protein
MDLVELISSLADPRAYPFPTSLIEVRHTHISVVFLVDEYAYKVKKPVDLGFLDFSTLAERRHFCEEEVRLNRRLAGNAYVGVVPITCVGGDLAVEGAGEVVEWAVKMRRLPDDATLLSRLVRGELDAAVIQTLARRIATFHANAAGGDYVAAFGRFELVAGNARENLTQTTALVGVTVSRAVHERVRLRVEEALFRLQPLIDDRARRGVPRDTHGDLHLDHVYYFPDRPPPDDIVIIDCIEFNKRFRFADPVADMAFLVMDLRYRGRPDMAAAFTEAYFAAADDAEGRALLPFYVAYRAAVRGKVEGMEATEREVPTADRATVLAQAKAHWLLALGALETPNDRPCLVLVAGLPGTGKSTLARDLADGAGFDVIRSDVVRKELAAAADEPSGCQPFGGGIYSPEWTDWTYTECLRRTQVLLFEGRRVIVDASFGKESRRRAFIDAAARWAVPIVVLVCKTDPGIVRRRLRVRTGDVSDADWAVYLAAVDQWEQLGTAARQCAVTVQTNGPPDEPLKIAMAALRSTGLLT